MAFLAVDFIFEIASVIPLVAITEMNKPAKRLNPQFEIEGKPVVMSTAELAGIPRHTPLGERRDPGHVRVRAYSPFSSELPFLRRGRRLGWGVGGCKERPRSLLRTESRHKASPDAGMVPHRRFSQIFVPELDKLALPLKSAVKEKPL